MQSYRSVFYQKKKEALLLITTLLCLKDFVSLIAKNKSKSLWHTEMVAKSRPKEKSSGRMRTKRQNRKGAVANRLRRRTSDQMVLGSNPAVAAALSPWTRSLLPLSQGEAFTLASISYLAILVKYILAKKKRVLLPALHLNFSWSLTNFQASQ